MASKVTTLFEDSAKTNALYPRTKQSAVSDADGNQLTEVGFYTAETVGSGVDNVKVAFDMDLVWTNPSPTSSFAAQTISLNLSNYKLLLIETIYDITDAPNTRTVNTVKVDTEGYNNSLFSCVNGYFQSRDCNVSSTAINFLEGKNASHNTNNNSVVPYKIYGIR